MSEIKQKTIFGMNPMKVLFAMEYVLQGLANPFQGITYQPFFRHFRFHYGMTAADTQMFFSKSYLAWSFKPLIGFLMDAIGKTKLVMIFLLLSGAAMYLLTPFFDVSAIVFYWMMFALAILFACTDVAVDRATVLTGDEESRASGRSKAATVGLNQSICWAAIYGTSIVAAAWGDGLPTIWPSSTCFSAWPSCPDRFLGRPAVAPGHRQVYSAEGFDSQFLERHKHWADRLDHPVLLPISFSASHGRVMDQLPDREPPFHADPDRLRGRGLLRRIFPGVLLFAWLG